MNRRELFKLCSQLAAGVVCAHIVRVLLETSPPIKLMRSQQREVIVHITAENPYISKEYIARVERAMRQSGDGIGRR